MRGFTLIETVVVVAILAILAFFSVENIINFQKSSLLDASANEFASTLKLAAGKSRAGEIPEGKSVEDFEEDGFPEYGVLVQSSGYSLFADYTLFGEVEKTRDIFEAFSLGLIHTVEPETEISFSRITGETNSTAFTLRQVQGGQIRRIIVSNEGFVSIEK